jgi:hypothetical protein
MANQRHCEEYSKPVDRLSTHLVKGASEHYTQFDHGVFDIPEQTWEQVFVKLEFEEMLYYMDSNPDFEQFYSRLAVVREKVTNLVIPLRKVHQIQSGYHFITSTIEDLPNTLQLGFAVVSNGSALLPKKCFKAIQKGLFNLSKKAFKLE